MNGKGITPIATIVRLSTTTGAALLMLGFAGLATAASQQKPSMWTAKSNQLSAGDRKFAAAAAQGGIAEIQLAQVAEQNASSPSVKAFAQRMVSDHSKIDQDLTRIAQSQHLTLPATPSKSDAKEIARLSKLHGTAFDRAYRTAMITDHNTDNLVFQQEAKKAQSSAIRQFAQRTLPTIQMHLRMAESMNGAAKPYAHHTNMMHSNTPGNKM